MKNKFKVYSKTLIFFFGVSLLLLNCEKENEIIEFSETTQQVKSNVNYISSTEVPEIVSSLERALVDVDFYTPNFTKSVSSQNTYIDYNKIMEVVSTNKVTTNFTFNLGVENAPDNEFYNLIVHKNSNGSIDKPYVIRYIVNPDAMSEFIAHNRDFRYFKGSYKIESFDRFFETNNLKVTGDCPDEGNLDSGGSIDPDTTFGSGDTIDSEGGINGITITSSFGSLLNNDNTGSYIYQINDARTDEAISGTVSPATALDVSYTINGAVTSISVPVGNDTTNVSVTINTDSSGCVTLSIIVGDIVILEFVNCPDVTNDFDKSTSTSDCPDPDGEIGLLPHPFLGCSDGDYLNPIDNKCYPDHIIDNLTGKAKCVYDKLNNSSTDFKNAIQKFDGEFPVSHLTFTINNSLPVGNYGRTLAPENYNITIEMSNTQLSNISDVGSAVAFAHEVIHAEIFRKMLSAAQTGNLDPVNMTQEQQINYVESLRDNFPGLYDYYYERHHPTWNHNMMAQHYRSTIADIAQEFDNSNLSRQVYEDIAWAGLRILEDMNNSVAWNNLSSTEQQRILNNLSNTFVNGTSNCN